MAALGELRLGDDLGVGDRHDAQPVGVRDVHVGAVGLDDVALVDADLLGVGPRVVLSLDGACAGASTLGALSAATASSVAAMSPSITTRPSP